MTDDSKDLLEHRRSAFLAGEGTLTAREVREWAGELDPARMMPPLPVGMSDDEPLMVSVVPSGPDTRGLTGATIIRSFGG